MLMLEIPVIYPRDEMEKTSKGEFGFCRACAERKRNLCGEAKTRRRPTESVYTARGDPESVR